MRSEERPDRFYSSLFLYVAQRLDRVHAGCAPGGLQAGETGDQDREQDDTGNFDEIQSGMQCDLFATKGENNRIEVEQGNEPVTQGNTNHGAGQPTLLQLPAR